MYYIIQEMHLVNADGLILASYVKKAKREERAAGLATTPEAKRAHLELAKLYRQQAYVELDGSYRVSNAYETD